MKYTVRFRFNKITGEVEEFLVDQETHLESAEHDRLHEKNTRELAGLLARFPEIEELPGARGRMPQRQESPGTAQQDDEAPIREGAGRADRSEQ